MTTETNTAGVVLERMAIEGLSSREELRKTDVLVIDSELVHRGHLRELIEREGFEARTFSDAYEVLRHLEQHIGTTRAVFIDLTIFSAVEKTLLALFRSAERTRLIVTCREAETCRVRELIGKGVHAVVRKPYSESEVTGFLH